MQERQLTKHEKSILVYNIETSNLPEEEKKSLLKWITDRVESMPFDTGNFDFYTYITNVIINKETRYHSRRFVSLEESFTDENDFSLLGVRNNQEPDILDQISQKDTRKEIRVRRLIEYLRSQLNMSQYAYVRKLLKKSPKVLNRLAFNLPIIIRNNGTLEKNIENAMRYFPNGAQDLPDRAVKDIDLSNGKVRYITGSKDGLPKKTTNKIYEAHGLGMSLSQAAEYSGTSKPSVQKYWGLKKLKPHQKSKKPHPQKVDQKIFELVDANKSAYAIAKALNLPKSTVLYKVNKYKKGKAA